jgi:hypothetical protein
MYDDNAKKSIYKWRKANMDVYRSVVRRAAKKNYDNNRAAKIRVSLHRYYVKKEFKAFLNILIDQ